MSEICTVRWQQALAEHEAAKERYSAFLSIRGLNDELRFGGEMPKPVGKRIAALLDEIEALFCNGNAIAALIAAPVPDWDAYRLKAEVALHEGYDADVAPFLVRDANALTGWEGATSEHSKASGEV